MKTIKQYKLILGFLMLLSALSISSEIYADFVSFKAYENEASVTENSFSFSRVSRKFWKVVK